MIIQSKQVWVSSKFIEAQLEIEDAKITEIDVDKKRISLSMRALLSEATESEADEAAEAVENIEGVEVTPAE